MKFTLALDNEQAEIVVTRQADAIRIERDGVVKTVRLVAREENALVVDDDGRLLRLALHQDGDSRSLWVNGRLIPYRRVRAASAAADDDAGSLAAAIPAVVTEILVAPGDAVTTGDRLILLESMKMVIPIQAPRDGVVEAVNCEVGDAVQPGVPLIALAAE